jgi:cyanophycinase-like exopeptidase
MRLFFTRGFLTFFLAIILANAGAQSFFRTGSPDNVETSPLPGIVLAGGASDNNDAMRWFLERADGGDIVVIRASGGDGYNNYLYSGLGVTVNSVTSIVISSTAQANNQEVYDAIVNAEALFIAGGNQWNYIDYWRNTLVQDALQFLIDEKQVTIGGTSAGLAVLGEVVYSAQNGTVWSSEALADPYHWRVTLVYDFLQVPFLENLVTDSHYNRVHDDGFDRKGRHVAFMARMATDWGMDARGIGVNEYTAVAVDENGIARVFGNPDYDDYAYFVNSQGNVPERCEAEQSLVWNHGGEALKVFKVLGNPEGNNSFDLNNWENGTGGQWEYWYVQNGILGFTAGDGSFQVRFEVLHGLNETPVQGARVELQDAGVLFTNNQGVVVFQGISPAEALQFQVSRDGFFTESGTLAVANENVNRMVFIYPDDGTSVNPTEGIRPLRVFPNPVGQDKVSVEIPELGAPAVMRVISVDGTLVHEAKLPAGLSHSISIPAHSWARGVYILRVESQQEIHQARLIRK